MTTWTPIEDIRKPRAGSIVRSVFPHQPPRLYRVVDVAAPDPTGIPAVGILSLSPCVQYAPTLEQFVCVESTKKYRPWLRSAWTYDRRTRVDVWQPPLRCPKETT